MTAAESLFQSSPVILECLSSLSQFVGIPTKLPVSGSNPTCTLCVKFVGEDTPPSKGHLANMASSQLCRSCSVFVAMYMTFFEESEEPDEPEEEPLVAENEFRSLLRVSSKQFCFIWVRLTLTMLVREMSSDGSSWDLSFLYSAM